MSKNKRHFNSQNVDGRNGPQVKAHSKRAEGDLQVSVSDGRRSEPSLADVCRWLLPACQYQGWQPQHACYIQGVGVREGNSLTAVPFPEALSSDAPVGRSIDSRVWRIDAHSYNNTCMVGFADDLADSVTISPTVSYEAIAAIEALGASDSARRDSIRLTQLLFDRGLVAAAHGKIGACAITLYIASRLITNTFMLRGAERGRVGMSTLGSNGRFANQIFQYAFLKLYALRHSLSVLTSPWEGQSLFALNDPPIAEGDLPELRFFAFDDDDKALWNMSSPPFDVDMFGYFQELASPYLPHRSLLRKIFDPVSLIRDPIDSFRRALTNSGARPLVAVHIRRGDYPELAAKGLDWYRPVPVEWYKEWLTEQLRGLQDPVVYIATDSPPDVLDHFKAFSPVSASTFGSSGIAAHLIDFFMLRAADRLAIANSSFSRMAAILAEDQQKCAIPDFSTKTFVPYQPWQDQNFWQRFAGRNVPEPIMGAGTEAKEMRSIEARRQAGYAKYQLRTEQHKLLTEQEKTLSIGKKVDEILQERLARDSSIDSGIAELRSDSRALSQQLIILDSSLNVHENKIDAIKSNQLLLEDELRASREDILSQARIILDRRLDILDRLVNEQAHKIDSVDGKQLLLAGELKEGYANILAQTSAIFDNLRAEFQTLDTAMHDRLIKLSDRINYLQNDFSDHFSTTQSLAQQHTAMVDRQVALSKTLANSNKILMKLNKSISSLDRIVKEQGDVTTRRLSSMDAVVQENAKRIDDRILDLGISMQAKTDALEFRINAIDSSANSQHRRLSMVEERSAKSQNILEVQQHKKMLRQPRWIVKRLRYRLYIHSLRIINSLFGWTHPKLRLAINHLTDLLRQRKYDDYHATVRRWFGRLTPSGRKRRDVPQSLAGVDEFGYHSPPMELAKNAPSADPIAIDVRSMRLMPDGTIMPKVTYSYPGALAAVHASIIIPCYNYGRYLPEAVESALNQTLRSVEVIIVDNGSEDPHTIEVVDSYRNHPQIKIVRLTPNRGLPAARNAGIEFALGEYVCSLDADDIFEPTYLEKAIALLESDHSVGFVHSWVQLFGDADFVWQTRDFIPEEAAFDNHTSVSAVFRRDDWDIAGRYNPDMHGGYDDWEFWIRLAMLGRRGKVIAEPLLRHRKHGGNMTGDAHAGRERWLTVMRQLSPAFFNDADVRGRLAALSPLPAPVKDNPFHTISDPDHAQRSDKAHVMVIVPWLPFGGGAEMLLLELLGELQLHYRISILTTIPAVHDMESYFRAFTDEIFHLPLFLPHAQWLNFIESFAKSRGTRVIFSSGASFVYDNAKSLKKRIKGVSIIDVLHNDLPTGHIAGALGATKSIDCHIAISAKIGEKLHQSGVPGKRLAVVLNGVDTEDVFRAGRITQTDARSTLGLPQDAFVVSYVGRLSDEKRPLDFIDIVAATDCPNIYGLLIGDGPMRASVNERLEQIKLTKNIKHIAYLPRDQLATVYAASDALVITSSTEGLPFVMLEAMAMKCPVLSTDVGDVSRVLIHGVNGYLVPADNPMAISPLLQEMAAEPARCMAMREAAFDAIIRGGYTRRAMLEAYVEIVARAIENDRR
ncbi:MAG: glycosyltransferase [Beijerinckiaceae bacterium]